MAIILAPVLASSDTLTPFHIKTDSSDITTEAVLSQMFADNDKWYLVVYFSKFLSLVKQNYEIHNKEMLAIIWVLKKWCHFLKGMEILVEIWTDYKNLEYFMIVKNLNCKQV